MTRLGWLRCGAWVSVLLLAAGLSACGQSDDPVTGLTPITLQLKWSHQAQFAGYYLAQDEGTYAAAELDVSFLAGGADVDEIGAVGSVAQFGVTSPEELLVARSEGSTLVAVAAIIQRNPLVFVSHADSGIETPYDFVGRTLAMDDQAAVQARTIMVTLELDPDTATRVDYEFDHAGFLAGTVDVSFAYATGGLVRPPLADLELNKIWPSDYGVDIYADVLVTTAALIANDPDLVAAFVGASLVGWQNAVERPAEAVTSTMTRTENSDEAAQTRMMEASLPLIHTGRTPIGWMEPQRWRATRDMLVDHGILTAPIDVVQAYTLAFLDDRSGISP